MRLFNQRTRNYRAVLQHVLQIDKVAVMHMLSEIIGVVEVNNPLVVRRYDIFGQKNPAGKIFRNFTRHIIALNAVHRGVFIGIFLLYLFVVTFDKRKNMRVRSIGFARQRTGKTVSNVLSGKRKGVYRHKAILHHILNLFHGYGTPHVITFLLYVRRKSNDFLVGNFGEIVHFLVGFAYRVNDFLPVEQHFLPVSFNDLHVASLPFAFTSPYSPYLRGVSFLSHRLCLYFTKTQYIVIRALTIIPYFVCMSSK